MSEIKKTLHLTGRPGSGKGTTSDFLMEKYPGMFNHYSVGELMREALKNTGSKWAKEFECINKGIIVQPRTTIEFLKDTLLSSDKKIILDGFPRSVEQAQLYNEIISKPDITIVLDVPEEECMDRIIKRSANSTRSDDHDKNALKNRFVQYEKTTIPAINWVKENNNVVFIDGVGTKEEVFARVEAALKINGYFD